MSLSFGRLVPFVAIASFLCSSTARAERVLVPEVPLSLAVEIGPVTGASNDNSAITFNAASRTKDQLYDVQDQAEHRVRGVPLTEIITRAKAPKKADTVVLNFSNGMQVPVRLADKELTSQLFIAFEHGDEMGVYTTTYPLAGGVPALPCPKIVFHRKTDGYTIWRYTSQLSSVRFVTWSILEATLAQPSRQLPTHPGWKLYARNCQPCHGMGGQGAKRGPDFISDLDAYRRVPPLAVTDLGDPPSLHDKVKGRAGGQMPTLDHLSNAEIKELWNFLHSVHKGAVE